MSETAPLPTALRELLVRARRKFKTAVDPDAKITLQLGWAEVRAIYALSTNLHAARQQRDKYRAQVQAANASLARSRADIVDHDLLQNRAVVALLIDVERVLSGEETSDRAMFDVLARVRALIARARKQDRRKKTRA